MKKVYFLAIALICINSAYAQWTAQTSGTSNYLYSVFFVDNNLGFAVGEGSTILKTTNGGSNWIKQNSGSTSEVFFSVFFVDSNIGYIANADNSVLKTTDGGTTWVEKSLVTDYNCMSLFFINADTGWVVSGCGEIFKTINGGNSWIKQLDCGASVRTCYFADANTGYAVGDYGNIIKTTDGGTNWVSLAGNSTPLMSTFFLNADAGYAVGEGGRILKTINGGINWENTYEQNDRGFNSVAFTDVNTGIVVGWDGTILKTTNGGTSWITQNSGTKNGLLSIFSVDSKTSYVVGMNGTILKTTCGGGVTTTANSETICNGASAILTAGGADEYVWNNGDTATSITVNPNTTTNYIVTGSVSGCSDTAIAKVNVYNLDVSAQNQILTCGGEVNLNSTSNYIGSSNIEYAWQPGYGLNDTTIANPLASPRKNTTYTISAITSDGCISSNNIKVDVIPFMLTVTDKNIVCGESALLATTTNYTGNGILSYLWLPGYGLNDSLIASPNSNPNHSVTYNVSAISTEGCISSTNVKVDVVPFTLIASDKYIVCGGSASLTTNTNYTGNGILSYLWQPGYGLTDSLIASPNATPNHTITYNVSAVATDGCSATKNIEVNVSPLAVEGSNMNISCGNSTTLQANSNYTGLGPLTYLWQTDNNLNYSSLANPIVQPNHNTVYRGTISTENGCSASNDFLVNVNEIMVSPEICIVTIDSSNKNVVIWEKPSTSAIDSFYIYRETESTNVYTKIGAVSYNEYSAFADTNSFPDVQSNKYEISIFDKCNFETQKSIPHKTMHLSINQGTGNSWNLIWEGYEGFQVSTYRIYRGTDRKNLTLIGTSPASNTQYSDFNVPANYIYYQIEILSPNACNPYKSTNSIRSNIATNAPLTIYETSNVDFKIYPNPASNYLIVENEELASECTLSILNINGQELIRQATKENKLQIDITNLPAGVYFVKLIADKSVKVRKFVKK